MTNIAKLHDTVANLVAVEFASDTPELVREAIYHGLMEPDVVNQLLSTAKRLRLIDDPVAKTLLSIISEVLDILV